MVARVQAVVLLLFIFFTTAEVRGDGSREKLLQRAIEFYNAATVADKGHADMMRDWEAAIFDKDGAYYKLFETKQGEQIKVSDIRVVFADGQIGGTRASVVITPTLTKRSAITWCHHINWMFKKDNDWHKPNPTDWYWYEIYLIYPGPCQN